MKNSYHQLALLAMFTALVAAGSVFSLPLPPPLPPVTLAVFFAILAGLLLGPLLAGGSVMLFLLLGSMGLPVFVNGSGGVGHFATPTGGFLLGYLLAAVIAGLLADRKNWTLVRNLPACLLAVLGLYAIGLPWFAKILGTDGLGGAALIMLPYFLGDIVKAIVAAALVKSLKPLLQKYFPSKSRVIE